jgi:copper chaperone CopZ
MQTIEFSINGVSGTAEVEYSPAESHGDLSRMISPPDDEQFEISELCCTWYDEELDIELPFSPIGDLFNQVEVEIYEQTDKRSIDEIYAEQEREEYEDEREFFE